MSSIIKHKLIALTAFSSLLVIIGGLSVTVSSVQALDCPGTTTTVSHGTRCESNGIITCDEGYTAKYYGSSLTCVPVGTETGPSSETINNSTNDSNYNLDNTDGKYFCGGDGSGKPTNNSIKTSIDFGCKGNGNALTDMAFAIIRWLSDGVGIVVVASLVVGGVQYSAAGGDPSATQAAIKRMRSAVTALIIFIFAYAILNYVLPGAFLK